LAENAKTAFNGIQKTGAFELQGAHAREWLKAAGNPNGRPNSDVLAPYWNGLDVTRRVRDSWIVDFGWERNEADAALYEQPFNYALETVRPERANNSIAALRDIWWRHWRPRPEMRRAIGALLRFVVTPEVAKYRVFTWCQLPTLPDKNLVVIARADDTTFGILHSRFHELWSLRLCTYLGVGNDPRYTPTTTFETFPFPAGLTPRDTAAGPPAGALAEAIAAAAIRLNELREAWLNPPEWVDWVITPEEEKAGFPKRPVAKPGHEADLKKRTLTNLYNARPAWLDLAHKQLDQAVAVAYGWTDYTPDMPDEEILRRLLALNLERARPDST
jgi:type II restriction/modification system DNA methylase subunit YeeA